MKYNFKEFYQNFLFENILKRVDQFSYEKILKKYFDDPDAIVSFRATIPTSSVKPKNFTVNNKNINPVTNPLIGINPKSVFNTPNGIYGYPIQIFKEKIEKRSVPYGGNFPVLVVYKPKKGVPILRTSTFSNEELEEKRVLLANMFFDGDLQSLKKEEEEITPYYRKSPAGTLWSLTRLLSNENPNKWAKLLISIGVPIFMDDAGSGIIHSAEPTQVVVFGKQFVDIIEVKENLKDVEEKTTSFIVRLFEVYTNIKVLCGMLSVKEDEYTRASLKKAWDKKDKLLENIKLTSQNLEYAYLNPTLRFFYGTIDYIIDILDIGEYKLEDFKKEKEILETLNGNIPLTRFVEKYKSLFNDGDFFDTRNTEEINKLKKLLLKNFDFNDVRIVYSFIEVFLYPNNKISEFVSQEVDFWKEPIVKDKIMEYINSNPEVIKVSLLRMSGIFDMHNIKEWDILSFLDLGYNNSSTLYRKIYLALSLLPFQSIPKTLITIILEEAQRIKDSRKENSEPFSIAEKRLGKLYSVIRKRQQIEEENIK